MQTKQKRTKLFTGNRPPPLPTMEGMKDALRAVANYYNTNAKFHSFVIAVEYALVGFVTSYGGGFPTSKSGWIALATGIVGAGWGACKRWLATNVATENLQLKAGGQ